jgi:hypothetical protein
MFSRFRLSGGTSKHLLILYSIVIGVKAGFRSDGERP